MKKSIVPFLEDVPIHLKIPLEYFKMSMSPIYICLTSSNVKVQNLRMFKDIIQMEKPAKGQNLCGANVRSRLH